MTVIEAGTRQLCHDIYSPKVLVIPRNRWLRLNMTEKLFTGTLNHNKNKNKKQLCHPYWKPSLLSYILTAIRSQDNNVSVVIFSHLLFAIEKQSLIVGY